MKLSTKTRYGVRALVDLARAEGNSPLSMEAIAENQQLSRKYLHNILTTLKNAGIVESARGPGGGFRLARTADRIGIGEVIRLFEGPLDLVECVSDSGACDRTGDCPTYPLWGELSRQLNSKLDDITLATLLK